MAIDYTRPYSASWRLYRVDDETWADAYLAESPVSASVTRSSEGESPEIDSGSVSFDSDPSDTLEHGYYRLAMVAEQDGEHERADIATLLLDTDGGSIERGTDSKKASGRSVLHPAATTRLQDGENVMKGADGAQKAAQLLRSCIKAPVDVEGGFALADHYCFDFGATVLDCVWRLLDAGGYCIQTDGRGRVQIRPMPDEPVLVLDRSAARLLHPKVDYSMDKSKVPNRFTAKLDGAQAQAVNDDPDSEVSYASRGYWVDEVDDSPALLSNETLSAYASRRLRELSTVLDERTYTRAWAECSPFDVVQGSMPGVRLTGDMRIRSQSYECGEGVNVTEKAAKEINLWR